MLQGMLLGAQISGANLDTNTTLPSINCLVSGSLVEEMATHSSILAWEITWTEEPGGLQSMELQKS